MAGSHSQMNSLLISQENKQDITRNLPSLTFECALDEEELLLIHLRQQSHAHTTIASATSAFLVHILNETRQIRADLARTTKQRRAIQLLTADSVPKDPLKVGLIGCGRLGSHIVNSLLELNVINPEDLSISTRRPDSLGELVKQGVSVSYNNVGVASSVHILFVCVLPSQLPGVVEEIHSALDKHTLTYCLVNHTTAPKLKRTLKTDNIIIPSFVFDNAQANKWNSCMSVTQALEDDDSLQKCCPLTNEGKASCVRLTDKWVELVICAFINQCTDLDLTSQAALDLLHGICMGMDKLEKATTNRFVERDFIINWNQTDPSVRKFPRFDLSKIHDNDSHVVKKLRESDLLQRSFSKKFVSVFQEYRDARRYDGEEGDETGKS